MFHFFRSLTLSACLTLSLAPFPPIKEHPSKIPRRIRTITLEDLVVPLSKCANLQIENTSKYLVDIARVIQESLTVVDEQMEKQPDEAGSIRRDPLVFSRLARGGKTTVLTTLFDELKQRGFLVMIVSFNGASGFIRQYHESAEEAMMRQIVRQLIDPTALTEEELQGLVCNEEIFSAFLDQQTNYGSSSQIPFLVLIDDLNILGAPLPSPASKLLQRLFLRKNRYLVFTTHIPFTLSAEEVLSPADKKSVMFVSSSTDMKVVRMPQCNDLSELRKMGGCTAITGHEATIYGGIPALVYSAFKNINFPLERFAQAMKKFEQDFPTTTTDTDLLLILLKWFLQELFNGPRSHGKPQLRFFDQFSSIPEPGKVRWPLCYLAEILNVFKISGFGVGEVIDEIYKISRRDIPVFASMVETGLDWQSVVDVAVLLRALEALLWKREHPLVSSIPEVKSIKFIQMPDEYRTLEQGQQFIQKLPPREPGHLYMIRSSYAKFPLFDGFLVAVLPMNVKEVTGYQVKLGRHTPRQAVPDWVNGGGVLIRGLAAASSSSRPNRWEFMSEDEIQEFLGYSLGPLYPASWVSGVRTEEMFD